MEILIKVSQFILSLSLIIVLHEFGHYWPARYFKIKVEKFYLFFDVNFSLFKKKIGETEWGIGWLPLGGYVKIAGMIDEIEAATSIFHIPSNREDEGMGLCAGAYMGGGGVGPHQLHEQSHSRRVGHGAAGGGTVCGGARAE